MSTPTTRTYSAEEDAILRDRFGLMPAAQIGALIGRSEHSVRNRAQALGLLCGVDAERELANAQGFPASYILDPVCWYSTDTGGRKYGRLPKTHQIAKIGNSVCPPLSEAMARALLPEHCPQRLAA